MSMFINNVKCFRYVKNDTDVKEVVRTDGVQLWIDEAVEEYYSQNEGPRYAKRIIAFGLY